MMPGYVLLARTGALLMLPALGACATAGDYPSLAIRDAERAAMAGRIGLATAPPAPLIPERTPLPSPASFDSAALGRIGPLTAAARSAHARFSGQVAAAQRQVAAGRGGNRDSDAWAAAQVALASLESARSQTAVPLADLEQLHAEAAIAGVPSDTLSAARREVLGLVRAEDATLARLRGQLGR